MHLLQKHTFNRIDFKMLPTTSSTSKSIATGFVQLPIVGVTYSQIRMHVEIPVWCKKKCCKKYKEKGKKRCKKCPEKN